MSQNHQVGPYHDALEVDPQQRAYTCPPLPIYATSSAEPRHQRTSTDAKPSNVAAHAAKKRLWILSLAGLFIALIAGLIGGCIGVAIQDARELPATAQLTASSSTNPTLPAPSSPVPSSLALPNDTSLSNQPAGTLVPIVAIDTGCKFRETKARNSLYNQTAYTRTSYTTICNSGWKDFAIIALYSLTPSDCVESCRIYNTYERQSPLEIQRLCVGAGFIPDWLNQTLAYSASRGSPFNCYLQHNVTGIGPNDQEQDGVEVVALCLDGCP